jgi:hypothetical protein
MGSSIRVALVLLIVTLLCQCTNSPTNPNKPNRTPLLAPVAPQTVQEGSRLEFIVQATDSDGVIPTISATNLPTNASAVDSGNGTMLFGFEPDLTQSGIYYVTFIASDGKLTATVIVTITVTPNLLADTWPMSVGNYWVYETRNPYQNDEWTLDSIHVQSFYLSDSLIHWRLTGKGFLFVGNDIAVRSDSILGIHHMIALPAVWADRADTVEAGIFKPTYEDCQRISLYQECLVFAKNVGVIRYEWIYESAHYPGRYEARLVRYYVK